MTHALRGWRTWVLAAPGLAAGIAMLIDHARDPFDAAREGTARYGHNGEHTWLVMLAIVLLELGVFLAILRPWTYRGHWGRALAALGVAVPGTMAGLLFTMHAGGIMAIHAVWLLAVTLGLLVAVLLGVLARVGTE